MDADAVPGALTWAGAQLHVADFAAAFEYLGAQDFVDPARIAMNGYCFGGGITWQVATELGGLKATAAFYGPAPDGTGSVSKVLTPNEYADVTYLNIALQQLGKR